MTERGAMPEQGLSVEALLGTMAELGKKNEELERVR